MHAHEWCEVMRKVCRAFDNDPKNVKEWMGIMCAVQCNKRNATHRVTKFTVEKASTADQLKRRLKPTTV
jgi:hypothetical protein